MKDGYEAAISAASREEFMKGVRGTDPKSFVVHHEKIEYFANKFFTKPIEEFQAQYMDFVRVPKEMREWVANELPKQDRPKTLVVWGPSRTGKTSWARSLGSHCYLNNAWSVEQVDPSKDYIIFDDVSFEHFTSWQPFLGE